MLQSLWMFTTTKIYEERRRKAWAWVQEAQRCTLYIVRIWKEMSCAARKISTVVQMRRKINLIVVFRKGGVTHTLIEMRFFVFNVRQSFGSELFNDNKLKFKYIRYWWKKKQMSKERKMLEEREKREHRRRESEEITSDSSVRKFSI